MTLYVTLDATEITNTSAKLWMNYNFRGYSGSVRFTYKPFGGNWTNTSWIVKSGSYNENVSGLSPNILYYFKAELTYDSTIIEGTEKSFTTTESMPLDTSVDIISPYGRDASPLTIIATGDPRLDNVILWYRWSDNNWTGDWTTLTYDDFEAGFGSYSEGGRDCSLYTAGTCAHQGNNAANIQDNSGDSSSFYLTDGIDVDAAGYTSIKVYFWFRASDMESGEDFWVQYYDGSMWQTVADYDSGDEFVNDQFYHEVVWVNETEYTFPPDMKIKFRCDASYNDDDVYIDEVYINATPTSSDWFMWSDGGNPDASSPWSWNFDFPIGEGYYEFYSIGKYDGVIEDAPGSADARCYYNPS